MTVIIKEMIFSMETCRRLKSVYRTKPRNLEDLTQEIHKVIASVTPKMLQNTSNK